MDEFFSMPFDPTKVHTVVYHMPDGEKLAIKINGLEHFLEFGPGRFCDTSDIDGVVHFYPRGNA